MMGRHPTNKSQAQMDERGRVWEASEQRQAIPDEADVAEGADQYEPEYASHEAGSPADLAARTKPSNARSNHGGSAGSRPNGAASSRSRQHRNNASSYSSGPQPARRAGSSSNRTGSSQSQQRRAIPNPRGPQLARSSGGPPRHGGQEGAKPNEKMNSSLDSIISDVPGLAAIVNRDSNGAGTSRPQPRGNTSHGVRRDNAGQYPSVPQQPNSSGGHPRSGKRNDPKWKKTNSYELVSIASEPKPNTHAAERAENDARRQSVDSRRRRH